jgi:hypothetical protein
MRSWVFRIAHNCAIDFVRARSLRTSESLDLAKDLAGSDAGPDLPLLRDEAVRIAVSHFAELSPRERSCVILKDVLEDSLEEISALLGMTLPAVKSALHRGRAQLKAVSAGAEAAAVPAPSLALSRYAALFNRRDWDGVRGMLLEDVRIEFVSRGLRQGRENVSPYFTHYAASEGWRLAPAWLEGHEVLAAFQTPEGTRPAYFIVVSLAGGSIAAVRDYRHVPYIARDASLRMPS